MTAGKNIVLCLDGTGNQLKATGNTNVVYLYDMLHLNDPQRQIAFYDPGVGTSSASGAITWSARVWTRLLGLAFGYGLRTNLAEAYSYLMETYKPGDRIYIFGFSRGAYTARALCAMLYRPGLLRQGSANLVPYAVKVLARNGWKDKDWHRLGKFSKVFGITVGKAREIPVEFLGIWDTVNAAGIFWWRREWPWTRKLPNVKTARHAVSIDEKRRAYRDYLVRPENGKPDLEEVWFAGVHSDVGGRFEKDPMKDPRNLEPRLSIISLKWMVDRAMEAGVLIEADGYARECKVEREYARAKVHRMGWFWILLTYRRRKITAGATTDGRIEPVRALIHESVAVRMDEDASYRPKGVGNAGRNDPDWLLPRSTAGA
jgi:uncharacterized protein (DUF2235 family)